MSQGRKSDWELPHEINLRKEQTAFLKSHFGPPANLPLNELNPEMQKSIEQSSPLAESRLAKPEWLKKTIKLYQKALGGDDRAFQELISRDPRYLCSSLGLYFISCWRAALDTHHAFPSTQAALSKLKSQIDKENSSPLAVTMEQIRRGLSFGIAMDEMVSANATSAKKNLAQISRSLLKPFDERGIREVPPKAEIKKLYFAALILFSGIKKATRDCRKDERSQQTEKLLTRISEISDEQIRLNTTQGFLYCIKLVAALVLSIRDDLAFDSISITQRTPSRVASEFIAHLFAVSSRTVQECARSNALVTWPSSSGGVAVFKPPLRLQDYDLAAEILRTK